MTETTHRFLATQSKGEVSALLRRPAAARWLYVLGHGAGAGMRHSFMEQIAERLAKLDVATFRYQFPYMQAGGRRPDYGPILVATVRSAVAAAAELADDLPLVVGGKSMGGRMTSTATAKEPLLGVRGLAFLGFPLHPATKPGTTRADHLSDVDLPMLFLQGDRDRLADLELLRPALHPLGEQANLQVIKGADHSFKVLKRSGRTDDEVMTELAEGVRHFCEEVCSR